MSTDGSYDEAGFSPAQGDPVISIVIKALDEERRIGACIESALVALSVVPGEVILADSGSSDRTVEIASRYPVRIVQLSDRSLGRCGIGPQLGYQFARGRFVYVLDADMEMDRGFLPRALEALEQDETLAGVAGLVEEASAENLQFRGRKARAAEGTPGETCWLDMGGLYRVDAIRTVGYLSNRNLHACEEQELGLRLGARGWRMVRLPVRSVVHHGHTVPTLTLEFRRLRSGYLYGPGEILRAGLGKAWLARAARSQAHLLATTLLWALLIAGIAALPLTSAVLLAWALAACMLLLQRIARYRSVRDALTVMLLWHLEAAALVAGLFRRQVDPMTPIEAIVITDGRASAPAREHCSGPAPATVAHGIRT